MNQDTVRTFCNGVGCFSKNAINKVNVVMGAQIFNYKLMPHHMNHNNMVS